MQLTVNMQTVHVAIALSKDTLRRHVLKRRRIQRENMERKWTFYMKMTDMTSIIINRCYTYIAFNNVNKIDPIILQLMVKGRPLNMELDT